MRLKDKVVIVTGGAHGMGESHAKRVIDEGGYVVICDINEELGAPLAQSLGERALFIRHDVTEEASWTQVVDSTIKAFGRIDVLVNNAGILTKGDIQSEAPDALSKVLNVNVVGAWLGIRAISPIMREQGGGSIINLSSEVGIRGWHDYSVYGTSKWAVRGLTKHLSKELGPYNIRVNTILPGAVDETGLFSDRVDAEMIAAMKQTIPLRRLVKRDDVSSLMVYLASDESSSTTGADHSIDCGTGV